MIVVAPMNRRPDQSVADFVVLALVEAASLAEMSARGAAPKALGAMTVSEESHVAAYKQGLVDGLNEARDLVAVLFAEMAVEKP